MPIYEFYCDSCNVLFDFLARGSKTSCRPDCPRCGRKEMPRQMSTFTCPAGNREGTGQMGEGIDESRLEKAFNALMVEARGVDEGDSAAMATIMRGFTEKSGLILNSTMAEAISRMEKGEDPDVIEKEMAGLGDADDLFTIKGVSGGRNSCNRKAPDHDEKLYEL